MQQPTLLVPWLQNHLLSKQVLYIIQLAKGIEVWEKYISLYDWVPAANAPKYVISIWLPPLRNWAQILDALQNMMTDVELDESFASWRNITTISYKGNHKSFKLPRIAHKPELRRVGVAYRQKRFTFLVPSAPDGLSIAKISSKSPSLKTCRKYWMAISQKTQYLLLTRCVYQKLSGYGAKSYIIFFIETQ